MEPARRLLAVAALVLLAGAAQAYYLPGTYPQEFLIGDVIQGEHLGGEAVLAARWHGSSRVGCQLCSVRRAADQGRPCCPPSLPPPQPR